MGSGRGPNTADSYIGSLISLTSKSEIRYEGILYTVDTENSNIALQNVRSFGTEGRKKDGPQIPASDKVYDYIIFRGSDIKDLQVKSSPPPPLQPPPPPSQPTDPAIISLQQSQPQYPPPSSLGSYNGGSPAAAGSSSEPSAPPPPYMGMPPSQYRGPVPPLYPPAGLQSWGPPPPPPGANGAGLGMPMYWQGYYRPPPAGHMQHQPMPPQPPPSLAAPPQGGQQQQQQGPQAPSLPTQLPGVSRPPGPVAGPSSSAAVGLASHPQAATSASSVPTASVANSAAPVAMAATTAPASSAASPIVSAGSSTTASTVASSIGTTASGSGLGVPVSAASSLPTSIQGVSAVITPMRGDPRRGVGTVSQAPQVLSVQGGGSSSQGLRTQTTPSAAGVSSGSLIRPQGEAAQSSGTAIVNTKSGAAGAQEQVAAKVEQKAVEPVNAARSGSMQASSQGPPAQEQASQPLLPLPSVDRTQQGMAQRGSHGVPVGQRNRWQGNGYMGNGNYHRRGRGRGSGSGRGIGLANPTQQFTEDFDFSAMNDKFNKDEVWGTLGGKDEEEYDYDDGHVEDDMADNAESDASKKALYNKDDFFDSLSCDTLDREGGRGERTKFSEQRKIDTETFGAFPMRPRGGRGFRGGRRGGYRGGYYGGGGNFGMGRGGGYGNGNGNGRGRGMGRPSSAIV